MSKIHSKKYRLKLSKISIMISDLDYYKNKMEQTEKYLNNILTRRLGSVVNQSSFSKNANNVSRIPRQQEQVETMPTVFRKQYETLLMQQSAQTSTIRSIAKLQETNNAEEERAAGSHRVEYMAISKRLMTKKEDYYISPTVDITKYQQRLQPNSHKVQNMQDQSRISDYQERSRMSMGMGSVKPKRHKIFS